MRESIEWCNIWVTGGNKQDRPRVLLVGDSIVMGYYGVVEKRLGTRAYCARLATSKCAGDPALLAEVAMVLEQYRFDVVHFNNGLHGWGYRAEQYRAGMEALVAALRKGAHGARLIWANTTPVRQRGKLETLSPRTAKVRERNRIAAEIMAKAKIPTVDLFGLVEGHPDYAAADGVHFSTKGRQAQGEHVAEAIRQQLPARPTR